MSTVLTIGHSTLQIDKFLALLVKNNITAVADVRSSPYSRHQPQYNREQLKRSLRSSNVKYVFLGDELGARSKDEDCYRNGRVQYELLAQTSLFQAGIARLRHGVRSQRIALMCAEREPLDCHRTVLVARVLDGMGINIVHIHSDGRLETHQDAMDRLLDKVGLPRGDLFRSRAELVSDALSRQEVRIAYVAKSSPAKLVRQP